jgi:hypothetical protein
VIAVATWNVLHRIHAENWGEDVLERWPDESERIAAITARLTRRTEQVIALQEVSGDKGALAVRTADALFVSTHVSGDQRRTRQLAHLAGLTVGDLEHPTALLGDFNADRATVASGLGGNFVIEDISPGALPTRPRPPGSKPLYIDHVAARGAGISAVAVEDADGLSDHNLVRADITRYPGG